MSPAPERIPQWAYVLLNFGNHQRESYCYNRLSVVSYPFGCVGMVNMGCWRVRCLVLLTEKWLMWPPFTFAFYLEVGVESEGYSLGHRI